MYSDNALVREVVALARAHNILHAIVCAGSRNAPLAHSFAACPDIEAVECVDERSAAFEALGMAEVLQEPVILCVTSGSAMLDASPAPENSAREAAWAFSASSAPWIMFVSS